MCGLLVGCGGQSTSDDDMGPDAGSPTCLTSAVCAEGSYCDDGRCTSAATRCPTAHDPVELTAARGLKTGWAWVINFRGQEVIWSQATQLSDVITLTPLDGGERTTIPIIAQYRWPGCLGDLAACWVSDGSDPTRRSIYTDFSAVDGEWLPGSGPRAFQAAGPIGFIVSVRNDNSRVLVEAGGSLREYLADGTETGTSFDLGGRKVADYHPGDDWWVQLRGTRTRSLMTARDPGVIHTLFDEDDIADDQHWNMAVEHTPDGFVAVVVKSAPEGGFTWSYYAITPGEPPRLIGQGPELVRDPGGGAAVMSIRDAWVSLPESRSRWVRCEERDCELLEVDLARVQMKSLSTHSFPSSDRVGLSHSRHVGCGLMEYVATQMRFETDAAGEPLTDEDGRWLVAESSMWMGRLGPAAEK